MIRFATGFESGAVPSFITAPEVPGGAPGEATTTLTIGLDRLRP